MDSYLHKDVFLDTQTARSLFHNTAAHLPVVDFHTHLPQDQILSNHRFENLWELWLKHDHYKWRLMRACGIPEDQITGNASPWEKFAAFASCLPLAPGNPVHHWAHLELQRVFNIHTTLTPQTAEEVWNEANAKLADDPSLSARGLLSKFKVELVCTTDDPTHDLAAHKTLAQTYSELRVLPTFRPDNAHNVQQPTEFRKWIHALSHCYGQNIENFQTLVTALHQRHDFFHSHGCRLSDHGLPFSPAAEASPAELESIFQQTLSGAPASAIEWEKFATALLKHVAQWNTQKDWTMQLHLGPQRNVNSLMHIQTGNDSGFDTMGSMPQTAKLIDFLDTLANANSLSKTIVYNLNPMESEAICCALQNFQNHSAKGRIQYGPAWWHCDHVRGIREQLDILASLGALGTSIGMLTDSRSFTSYVRHEYYRRLLCQYLGKAAEAGEIPNQADYLEQLVANLCYHNPNTYFAW
ncbi:glucuronate isomerase [Rubritalea tangerina]